MSSCTQSLLLNDILSAHNGCLLALRENGLTAVRDKNDCLSLRNLTTQTSRTEAQTEAQTDRQTDPREGNDLSDLTDHLHTVQRNCLMAQSDLPTGPTDRGTGRTARRGRTDWTGQTGTDWTGQTGTDWTGRTATDRTGRSEIDLVTAQVTVRIALMERRTDLQTLTTATNTRWTNTTATNITPTNTTVTSITVTVTNTTATNPLLT